MNQYITGTVIKELREKNGLSQNELAEKLHISDKTVSKWETGKGYPDITMLEPIASALGVSIAELISGNPISNMNVSSNMMRSKIYVCPVCGNVICATGEAAINCHGILLIPEEAEESNDEHRINVERIEDEYFVTVKHPMTKDHYISFLAAASSDRIQILKLYPEGNAEGRFKINGIRRIYAYCSREGLFYVDPKKQ